VKKKTLLSEVRKMQKIAGLLKEDDFDLSDTPAFGPMRKKFLNFALNLDPRVKDDQLVLTAAKYAGESNDPDEFLMVLADVLGSGHQDFDAFDGVFAQSDIENAARQAGLPEEFVEAIMDNPYVSRLELG